jgi:hypothetical protein
MGDQQKFVPLSARHSRRKRIAWETKGLRERVALKLAPWLSGPTPRPTAEDEQQQGDDGQDNQDRHQRD